MFRMINPVQDYAWGSTTAFSELFGWAESTTPQAELWMGAHPKAPSQIQTAQGQHTRLDAHLGDHPEQLGDWAKSGTLPFLLKVLAVEVPLSIQAHPTREQAMSGFAKEEAAGIPIDAPDRNYVDAKHKPELIVALTDFAALGGFREPRHTLADLAEVRRILTEQQDHGASTISTGIAELCRHVEAGAFGLALQTALESRAADLSADAALIAEADLRAVESSLTAQSLDTIERITAAFPADPGLFVALMLQRVDLTPGEALFLPSGTLHAYLHGVGVEVMANSDNVLRGGLTAKHVDVAELLRTAETRVLREPRSEPQTPADHQHLYQPQVEEFALHRFQFPAAGAVHLINEDGPAIALCTHGTVSAGSLTLSAGDSVFIPAAQPAEFSGSEAQVFIATVASAAGQEAVGE